MEHLGIISLLLRIVTGTLFFFQGYDKIFKIKIKNVARTFNDPANPLCWHKSIVEPMIAISSWAEMICGVFLIFGLFKFYTLSILSIDLVFVAFTFSSLKAMWDMQHFFPRFIFLLFIWSIPFSADVFNLDKLFGF